MFSSATQSWREQIVKFLIVKREPIRREYPFISFIIIVSQFQFCLLFICGISSHFTCLLCILTDWMKLVFPTLKWIFCLKTSWRDMETHAIEQTVSSNAMWNHHTRRLCGNAHWVAKKLLSGLYSPYFQTEKSYLIALNNDHSICHWLYPCAYPIYKAIYHLF